MAISTRQDHDDRNDRLADLEARLSAALAQRDEAIAQQHATSEILTLINASPGELAPVFDAILEKAHRLCGAPCGSLQLYEHGYARPVAVRGMTAAFDHYLRQGYRLDDQYARVNLSPVPVQQLDLAEVLKEFPDVAAVRAAVELGGIRTFLSIPLVKDTEVLGRIVAGRQEVLPFTDRQIALLQGFAAQAVIAIENARLLGAQQAALERQTATAEILSAIAHTPGDADQSLHRIAEITWRLFDASSVSVMIADGEKWGRVVRVGAGSQRIAEALPLSHVAISPLYMPGAVYLENRQVHVPDADDPEAMARWPGLAPARAAGSRTLSGTPLRREGKAIGAMIIHRDRPAPFTEDELVLLQSFADQAAIATENARLINETREALERQTATADILKVIAGSPSDVQPVFEAIAHRSKRLVDALSTTVYRLVDGVLHLKAFTTVSPEADAALKALFPVPLSQMSWGSAIAEGRIFRVVDTENETEVMRDLARLRGFRSMLFVPLLRDGAPIGVIAVTRVAPGPFADHHVELLQTFADQAVIAIQNVQLFDEVQAKSRDLSEALTYQTGTGNILKVIASSPTDVGPVLRAIVDSACELCDADDAVVHLRKGDYMFSSAHHGSIPISFDKWPINRKWLTGRAVLDKVPVHVHDVLSAEGDEFPDAQRLSRDSGNRTLLSVPLLREGESIGAIVLRRTEVKPFSAKQIDLLKTFADQAVIAIGNVRLFDEVQARSRELSQSLEELRTAQDRLVQTEKLASLGQLTAGIAHEIKNPLNFVNNFAALSAELIDELNDVLAAAPLDGATRGDVGELTHLLKGNLEKVVQHGRRADSIVKNMLLHSREGSGEHRPADINALLEESLNLAYHGARAEKPGFNITLQRDFDAGAGDVDVFPQEITRVLLNLISNGFYATAKRKAEEGPGFEPTLTATTRGLHNAVEVRIRDNGTGIPPEVRDKMFNPFFTTKPAGEGTGLGLSMSHDIVVKQHGGLIAVETEPGSFTEFIITLPRAARAADQGGPQ